MKQYFTLRTGLAVFLILASFASLAGVPILSPETIGSLALMGMVGNVELLEVKKIIEDHGRAWQEFKATNDTLMKAKADGKAVSDIEAKLAVIGADLDKLSELKSAVDDVILKAQRSAALGGSGGNDDMLAEVKSFNLAARAHAQLKGRTFMGDIDAEGYRHYKSAFFKRIAGQSVDDLSPDERKALQAGSDTDGGYLLPHSTVGRVVAKLYEQSVMRRLADVRTISTQKIEGMVDNDETDAGWVSELGARTGNDGTPTLGKWEIEAFEMYAKPKASQTLLDDAATDVEGWLAGKVAAKFARVEGTGFTTGTGVGQPRGLFAYSTAATSDDTRAWGTFEHVVTGANASVAKMSNSLSQLPSHRAQTYQRRMTMLGE